MSLLCACACGGLGSADHAIFQRYFEGEPGANDNWTPHCQGYLHVSADSSSWSLQWLIVNDGTLRCYANKEAAEAGNAAPKFSRELGGNLLCLDLLRVDSQHTVIGIDAGPPPRSLPATSPPLSSALPAIATTALR